MPRFIFDLIDGTTVCDETGQELRDEGAAKRVAEKLARDIYKIRPELRGDHFAIKVRDAAGDEVHRARLTADMHQ
jgi:hypothetical protein